MSETTTIAHARKCSGCGESIWLRHFSKDGMPLFSLCILCDTETQPDVLPPAPHHNED